MEIRICPACSGVDMEKLKAWKVDPSDESWMNK